jgi:hypothetical protein
MSKTGLWPREKPRPTDSHAELNVYDALRQQLPGTWTAWHSLRIRTNEGCEGEGDFVLAVPGRIFTLFPDTSLDRPTLQDQLLKFKRWPYRKYLVCEGR